MSINIIEDLPTTEEYCELRKGCGLSVRPVEAARISLPRSLHSVIIRDREQLIAMGRIVGDLGCHVQIIDITVRPEYQKRGLSHKIMSNVMNFIEKEVPSCAFVNLFADVDYLYQKYGFFYEEKTKNMYLKRK